MKKGIILFALVLFAISAFAEEFPLRLKYSDVEPISTEELLTEFDGVIVIKDIKS